MKTQLVFNNASPKENVIKVGNVEKFFFSGEEVELSTGDIFNISSFDFWPNIGDEVVVNKVANNYWISKYNNLSVEEVNDSILKTMLQFAVTH